MAAEAAARKKAWIEADQAMAATLNEDANLKADAAAQTLAQLEVAHNKIKRANVIFVDNRK